MEEEKLIILPLLLFFVAVIILNILALDQARNGAWSVFDYESKELIGKGTFSFDSKKYTYAKTILHIEELIASVIIAYDVSAIFIEDIQLRANVQAFKKLAQLQGVLVNLFEKNDYLYGYVAPTQWQNFCKVCRRNFMDANGIKDQEDYSDMSGKKDSKILSIKFVKDQFCIDTDNDNLADAICIGYYVVNTVEIDTKKNRKEKTK